MDGRERWQALQARLTAARAAVENGDRTTALSEIAAALDLDKDFLAAQALRDRIMSMGDNASPADLEPVGPAPVPAAPALAAVPAVAAAPADATPGAPAASSTSEEPSATLPPAYAKFEQRARRRRVDCRVDAARAAIDRHRLGDAAAALDEVIDLEPDLPELAELTARFDALRRAAATPHRGPWMAAAAVFAAALLSATWVQESSSLLSRQIAVAAPLLAPLTPIVAMAEMAAPVAVTDPIGERERAAEPARSETAPQATTDAHPFLPLDPLRLPVTIAAESPAAPPATEPGPGPGPQEFAVVPVSMSVPASVDSPDESQFVRQALQQYRSAYERLDAQSAQSVWPAVNGAALARAFDGLESQSLTFDACDVRLRGEGATATCRGSARYVTKAGSRDPHVEPRVWNFTLHKAGGDWKIDSARAER